VSTAVSRSRAPVEADELVAWVVHVGHRSTVYDT